jgi:hypothetical protein
MNKKAITLKFLVTLILGILLFGSTAVVFSQCFRLSDKGSESFGELVENIQAMEKRVEGEIESSVLIMDKETAIIGFNKTSERVVFDDERIGSHSFERPARCAENKACLCLCRKGFELKSKIAQFELEYICDETSISCPPLENIDFPSKISDKDFGVIYPEKAYPRTYEFSGGFLFVRKPLGGFPSFESREAAVYLERYKEGVALCFDPPCIEK